VEKCAPARYGGASRDRFIKDVAMDLIVNTGKLDYRRTVTWPQASAADNATLPRYAPIWSMVCATIQVVGSGSAVIKGSNDGVNYVTLKDLAGNDLTVAAGELKEFSSGVAFVKPEMTGGPADVIITHWQG
jgi:hypothetical protein